MQFAGGRVQKGAAAAVSHTEFRSPLDHQLMPTNGGRLLEQLEEKAQKPNCVQPPSSRGS